MRLMTVKKRSHKYAFLLTLFILLVMFMMSIYLLTESQWWRFPLVKGSDHIMVSAPIKQDDPGKPTVLLVYTPFWGRGNWFNPSDDCSLKGIRKTSCNKSRIEVTYDKKRFNDSDFVLFSAVRNDMPKVKDLNAIMKEKPSSQLWIYLMMESPNLTPDANPLYSIFDLTYTYKSNSDFWLPYGDYREISPRRSSQQVDVSVGKEKLIYWVVSNCRGYTWLRQTFVHELQKYIAVDVFGKCSGVFGPHRGDCHQRKKICPNVFRRYKFYLSLENALCEDYITEKYWMHLGEEDNVIPIVMGGANYKKLAIPQSYINVMDFKTVKDLADYLHYLDRNNTAYNEYFKWRQKYQVFREIPYFCPFCEAISSNVQFNPRRHANLTDFWFVQGKCHKKNHLIINMWNSTGSSSIP